MNAMVARARRHLRSYGGVRPSDAPARNNELRAIPYGARGYLMPKELVAERAERLRQGF